VNIRQIGAAAACTVALAGCGTAAASSAHPQPAVTKTVTVKVPEAAPTATKTAPTAAATAPPRSQTYVEPVWYPAWSSQPFSGYTAYAMPDVPGAVAWTVVSCQQYQCTSSAGAGPDGSTCGPVINNGTSQVCATAKQS
jgi:hypothetical protein